MTKQKAETVNLVIVGSGPAGYTAAIYASRANLSPVLYEGFFSGPAGGQLMTTTDVENFPGFPEGIMGPKLMDQFRNQAARFGTKIISDDVVSVDFSAHPYHVVGKIMSTLQNLSLSLPALMLNALIFQVLMKANFGKEG